MKNNHQSFTNACFLAASKTQLSFQNCLFCLCFTLITPLSIAAQAPNISYSGVAVSYPRNVAITSLTPTNSGGAITGTYAAVTTLAGSGTAGSTNGTGTAASFSNPYGIAIDASDNTYISDLGNYRVRKTTSAGVVTTFAGSGTSGSTDGTGTAASFGSMGKVGIDASGNLYVADRTNAKIRKVTPAGVVTTFAGSGSAGSTDGTGTAASFNGPEGVVVDGSGTVYVADYGNHKIRKITAAGVVTTFAGSGTAGGTDRTGTAASFNGPEGIALDADGNVYVAEFLGNKIRKITPAGAVTTLAGSGTASSTDGTGTAASFNGPSGVAVDAAGLVYVIDFSGHKIRRITPAGLVTTIAGSGTAGSTNGTGTAATFNNPVSTALSTAKNYLLITEYSGNRIRKLSLEGYSITPALPTGMSINSTTGVISGTPTAAAASTTYTITGINASGTSTTTITFSVVTSYKWKGTTTSFSTASNWESNIAPTSTSAIVIPTTTNPPTLSATTTVASVAFSGNTPLVLGNFNLTTSSITGSSSTAYIVTNGTGSLIINNISTSATLFPVGPSTTVYAPATITNSVTRNFTVKVGTTITSPISGYKYVNLQWDITPSVLTGNTATLALGWSSGSQAVGFNPASAVQVNHYNTTSSTWDVTYSATLSGTDPYTATVTNVTSFSPFSISNTAVLPVELLSFEGKNTEGGNWLTWETANEVNNKGFEVERLIGCSPQEKGDSWEVIGFVNSKGKSATYTFIDNLLTSARFETSPTFLTYYRLRQIDIDGKETLSKVISIENKGSKDKLLVYPNPASSVLNFKSPTPHSEYQVINLFGQVILRGTATTPNVDVSALPKGSYVLKIGAEQVTFVKQ
ncbi:MAG: T9SS type A sorting domain-containing protein [Saprospiraceae bacterium]|nr:T9SS type A sorting domain-containing protein [Saprospiraceae bacterium]